MSVYRPDGVGPAGVTVPAIQDDADVQRDHIAGLEYLIAGYSVHDLIVDGNTDAGREAMEALERGHAAVLANVLLGDAIQFAGRDTWLDVVTDHRMSLGHQPTGIAHQRDLFVVLQGDLASGHE
jgi:hypothetical protein